MHSCSFFIRSYESIQIFSFIAVKYSIETFSRAVFVPLWINAAPIFVQFSHVQIFSQCTWYRTFEIPTSSASSYTFKRRSSNTTFWIVFTNSDVVTSFGRPQNLLEWNLAQLWCWLKWYISNESIVSHNDDHFFHVYKFTGSVYYWSLSNKC